MYALLGQAFDDLLAEPAQSHAGLGHLRAFFDMEISVPSRRLLAWTCGQLVLYIMYNDAL
jgi:hypothetical protein